MIYIANIIEKKYNTNTLDINRVAQLIDAIDKAEATEKLNSYYDSLSSGSMYYDITIEEINETIS